LTLIAETLAKDFDSAVREDLQQLVRKLKDRKTARASKQSTGRTLSARSLEDYQNTIKKFWRWLKAPLDEEADPHWNPPETAWMKRVRYNKNLLPEDLLKFEEKNGMVEVADHPRDKAYIEASWDSGARPGEILALRIRDIEFDRYGAVVTIRRGKTGDRRVRLIESCPSLATWIDNHPQRDNPAADLWVNIGTTNHGKVWDYYAARKMVRELCRKAGIKKHISLYSFRHGRATQLANYLTESQLCQHFGWEQGSKMPRVYVHLSGRDVDAKLLELHGLKPREELDLSKTIRICPRCKAKNGSTSKFCNCCGSALDLQAALEVEDRVGNAEKVLETLLSDSEVKLFLARKVQELGIAGDPARESSPKR